ncbi:hypothetical protein JOC24_003836 [Streptomyces sp. HB132]|nr:hypothetical protein [Streptomyces sp. HB132]
MDAAADELSVSRPNHRSTWFIQEEPVGVKWTWKRGCFPRRTPRRDVIGEASQLSNELGGEGRVCKEWIAQAQLRHRRFDLGVSSLIDIHPAFSAA